MALPPLPEDNTARLFLDYEGPYGKRTMQFRSSLVGGISAAAGQVESFVNIIRGAITVETIFTGLRLAEAGSNVSNPVEWLPIQGTVNNTLAPTEYPRFFAFWGRGNDGRETKLTVYGGVFSVTADYRLQRVEQLIIGQAIDYLNSTATFTTISGSRPTWKQYANTGYNAYHQRKRRTAA